MQDPIGSFQRIRDLYISYLNTAFRIEDPSVAAEREDLLTTPGTLCTDPLIEPVIDPRACIADLFDIGTPCSG